jgi:glycosyltransferase involved in cell wall biosynthesis
LGTYLGSRNHQEALETLSFASLLILPSLNEPFPISIIESLCLGTPVVVMEDCGLVSILREIDPDFISSFSVEEIVEKGSKLLLRYGDYDNRIELSKRALAKFGMQEILSLLSKTYKL